jgi:DNA-directed RNA polymerase subunit RPC12/RpoP
LDDKKEKPAGPAKGETLKACPHCGTELSLWEQVLLSVDRTLMCKNCWYRIILDVFEDEADAEKKSGEE